MSPAAGPARTSAETPRVMFVIPGDGQGSSMIFARRQAHSVEREGLEVHVFHLSSRTSPRRVLAEWRRFRSELARVHPAVVHAHFGTVTALFSALASGSVPLLITYRGSDLNPPPSSYPWLAKVRAVCGCVFSQVAALRAQRIVCRQPASSGTACGGGAGWCRFCRPGSIPGSFFPFLAPSPGGGWDGANWRGSCCSTPARDPRGKRLDLAKAAVEKARLLVPAVRLEILEGTVEPALVPDLMNAADCLLVTSVWEGSPTVVQEALACDLPVVSVDVGDVVERFEGVDGATVCSSDAAVLGRAVAGMVEPPRRSDGSLKAAEFSSQRIAAELKEIYRKLAGA